MIKQNKALILPVLAGLLLNACAAPLPIIPEPLVRPRAEARSATDSPAVTEHGAGMTPVTSLQDTPKPPEAATLSTLKPGTPVSTETETASITVAFDQMPLPNFVQAVYGVILKKNYSMDPQVSSRKDLVTLRAGQPQTPRQIENAARLLLKTYGVAVTDLGAGNYRITPDNTQTGYAPEILRGRALPEVPLPLRPIYQIVELHAVRSSEISGWLTKIFGSKVSIIDDTTHNTLILSGQSDDVAAVLEAIHVLDQPLMKGRHSRRINPVFWSAEELSKKLIDVLAAEGYSASSSSATAGQYPINLIPVQGINALIVFAADTAVMQHITDWAKEFDKPNISRGSGGGFFTYQVRYTNAETLAHTMQAVMGEAQQTQAAAPTAIGAPGSLVIGTPAAPKTSGRVIVNAATNTLIFPGDTQNHTQLLALLQDLDRPAKAALIEVTVAEVTLDNTTQLGVEWGFNGSTAGGGTTVGGTLSGIALGAAGVTAGLGVGTGGLTVARFNSRGDLRLLLNMLATSSKANVLSSPRILARNGETATIQVGSEIPTINVQQTSAATAGGGVLQSVEYRKTGIILNVKPIIYAGDRIDLDVSQEVSDSTRVGVAGSPIIDTRRVDTHLSLRDGAPVLLGGLISQNNSRADTGVPLLKDLPFIGQLFRSNTENKRKTELLVLITPYIVADDLDAQEITEAFRNQLGEWARTDKQPLPPTKKTTLTPAPPEAAQTDPGPTKEALADNP
jgi:general secretion pathway protein D